MADISFIISIIQIISCGAIIMISFSYILAILFLAPPHYRNKVFKINLCVAALCCYIYFIIFFSMSTFNVENLYVERWCLFLLYMYMVSPAQVSLSFLTYSAHRFCRVIYHSKRFFRQNRWANICIASQWILGYMISIPFLIRNKPVGQR